MCHAVSTKYSTVLFVKPLKAIFYTPQPEFEAVEMNFQYGTVRWRYVAAVAPAYHVDNRVSNAASSVERSLKRP